MEELSEITSSEVASLFDAMNLAIRVLKKKYSPRGFNVGFNIGEVSGASIPHLHAHVVPRYGHELGFIDIVGASKVLIDNPETYVEDLKKEFGTIGRDPRGRQISIAFIGMADSDSIELKAGDDATKAQWFDIDELPELAFDHDRMAEMAIEKIKDTMKNE